MPGYAHIFRLGTREGTYGRTLGEYQFSYSTGGNSWTRTFADETSLAEFLRSDIALAANTVDTAMEELRRAGQTTLADIEVRESELPAMGLEQLPSDY